MSFGQNDDSENADDESEGDSPMELESAAEAVAGEDAGDGSDGRADDADGEDEPASPGWGGIASTPIGQSQQSKSPEEVENSEDHWTILVWGNPGMGKTHFACTYEGPTILLDTESKADDVARKFDDVWVVDVNNYEEARDALDQAIRSLDEMYDETGERGCIAVDSFTSLWDMAQQQYANQKYGGKDFTEINFSAGFGDGGNEWTAIKRLHNKMFRDIMTECGHDIIWTAMQGDDVGAVIQNDDIDVAPKKAQGEKNNVFAADSVMRLYKGRRGISTGMLTKSGKIDHKFYGLEKPTFDKFREVIRLIDDAEQSGASMEGIEDNYGVTVVEGDPEQHVFD